MPADAVGTVARRLPLRALPALAAIAAALPYLPVVSDYFVQDDFGVVGLLSQKPAGYFPRWFVSTWMEDIWGYTPDEIRPFPAVTYQVAALWGAASPVANHVINIAFHAATTVLVFWMGRTAAGLGPPAALAGALLFAWLPMQPETVAWVTGRVDSMPACFYIAAFLLFVRWRSTASGAAYAASIACCFLALFSKQNTITLPAALLAYDVMVRREPLRRIWRGAAAYAPFVVLTAAYLALRWALFGEVAREGMLTAARVSAALSDLSLHLRRLVYGEAGVPQDGMTIAVRVGVAVAAGCALAFRYRTRDLRPLTRAGLYFLIVWTGLGTLPTLVAGYASPRHMYLASSGWTVGLAVLGQALWHARVSWIRRAAAGALVVLLAVYGLQLRTVIAHWRLRAQISRDAVAAVEREAMAAPAGTLIVAGVPRASWDFAVPHALRPPFTRSDLTARVSVITHSSLYCCSADQWDRHTRSLMRAWRARPRRPPVIALYWDPATGAPGRVTDSEEPYLRTVMELLPETGGRAALDEAILDTLAELVAPRARR